MFAVGTEVTAHTRSRARAACQEGGATRSANGEAHMKIGEAHAARGQRVDMRRLSYCSVCVTTDIAVAVAASLVTGGSGA